MDPLTTFDANEHLLYLEKDGKTVRKENRDFWNKRWVFRKVATFLGLKNYDLTAIVQALVKDEKQRDLANEYIFPKIRTRVLQRLYRKQGKKDSSARKQARIKTKEFLQKIFLPHIPKYRELDQKRAKDQDYILSHMWAYAATPHLQLLDLAVSCVSKGFVNEESAARVLSQTAKPYKVWYEPSQGIMRFRVDNEKQLYKHQTGYDDISISASATRKAWG